MQSGARPLVLVVDDEPDVRSSLARGLGRIGYNVLQAESGLEALAQLDDLKPDLVLMDVSMPGGLDGYETCRRMLARDGMQLVPVIFVTGLDTDQNQAAAFAAGGAAFLGKPFELDDLKAHIAEQLATGSRWRDLVGPPSEWTDWETPVSFDAFKAHLVREENLPAEALAAIEEHDATQLYTLCDALGLPEDRVALHASRYLNLAYTPRVHPDDVAIGILPRAFCETNLVVPVYVRGRDVGVVLANPFNGDLLETLNHTLWRGRRPEVAVTPPSVVRRFFDGSHRGPSDAQTLQLLAKDIGASSVADGAQDLLALALERRATDLVLRPRQGRAPIRMRVDGDLEDVESVNDEIAQRLMSLFETLAELPQAAAIQTQVGSFEVALDKARLRLLVSRSSSADGVEIRVRILEPSRPVRRLERLGMAPEQVAGLTGMIALARGTIIAAGPPGSGKSTTLFSALSRTGSGSRSVMTVERLIEHRIPFAQQLEIDPESGATLRSLFRTVMRHAPDVLLVGDVTDMASARATLDYATLGGLTLGTLEAPNAGSAMFRLEQLGVDRAQMADALLGVVAQRLLRRLCPTCRRVRKVEEEEAELLGSFTNDVPREVAEPAGCDACRGSGYLGRDAVYEVLRMDAQTADQVKDGTPFTRVRAEAERRGTPLMHDHALRKVRSFSFSLPDAREHIFMEELNLRADVEFGGRAAARPSARKNRGGPASGERRSALVVDDDPVARMMLKSVLEGAAYRVGTATDGSEALKLLQISDFDVIVSDMNMPNVDGLGLLHLMKKGGIGTPLLIITVESDEGLESLARQTGAADFIQKPVSAAELLDRIDAVLVSRAVA